MVCTLQFEIRMENRTMKKQHRILAALLSLLLLIACAACAKAPADQPDTDGSISDIETTPTPEPSTDPTEEPEETPEVEETPEPTQEPSPEPTAQPEETPDPVVTPAPTPVPTPYPEPTPTETPETGDSGTTTDLAAFYDTIAATYTLPAMMDADSTMLDSFYPGLSAIATKQLLVKQAMISAVVCEVVLVECENSDDVQAVSDILAARVQSQVDGGAWYPASIEGWENDSRIVTQGNFVMLIVFESCDDIVNSFNALFAE